MRGEPPSRRLLPTPTGRRGALFYGVQVSLYISNPTKQHSVFFYREPVENLLASVEIASGGQAEIGHGWSPAQKAKVIAQLDLHGARDAAEAHGRIKGKFLGLLYRDRGVISTEEIETGHAGVVETQEQRAVAEATKAALGFDRGINKGTRGRRAARMTEVVVEQQLGPHERATGNEVAMSIQIDPEGRSDAVLPG